MSTPFIVQIKASPLPLVVKGWSIMELVCVYKGWKIYNMGKSYLAYLFGEDPKTENPTIVASSIDRAKDRIREKESDFLDF